MTDSSLATERLQLRPLTADDLDHLVTLDSDPAVMRYLSGGKPTPRALIEREVLPRFLRLAGDGLGGWAAIERSSGEFLGWFLLRAADEPATASLGYRLRRAAWGRGYATEGCRALIHRGFTNLGLQRIIATTYEDNLASRRVLEKLGFTVVRRFHLDPEDLAAEPTYDAVGTDPFPGDDLEYALTPAQWEARQKSLPRFRTGLDS
ncbi:MAG TPA: GNAT family N-acetyltransferase [Chloroflexota bacterium]|nr:GNAT family N-acetyltransferase [Chloroflexota bacterium]